MSADWDIDFLTAATRRLHESIRAETAALLHRARVDARPELATQPGAWGAGDVSYALDDAADRALGDFVKELGARHPSTLVAEGPGVVKSEGRPPAGAAAIRALVDPVDGTRSLMHDMRSAWALTGIAPEREAGPRLSDIELAVQTELPTTTAAVYHVLTAVRGRGATIARHDVRSGDELDRRPLRVSDALPLDNGYYAFTRYMPVERPLVADLERRFLERITAAHGLEPRLMYDDQYLCSAGQLFLVATGRYRALVDLRGWLRRRHGIENFTAKPYDLATALVFAEAGVPVLDADGAPLDAPMDTETPLSVVAYGNESLRAAFEPHLREAMEESLG